MGYGRARSCGALLAVLVLASACSGEQEPDAPADTASALSAARPGGAAPPVRSAAAPPAAQPRAPQVDACTLIPHGVAERLIGAPLHTTPLRASISGEHALATCSYAAGGGSGPRPALRLGLVTERSFRSNSMSLDGWWQSRTIGDSSARKVEALDGRAWWVRLPPPQRRELLVQGRQGIYVLGSLHYGANALRPKQLEELAEALLAAE